MYVPANFTQLAPHQPHTTHLATHCLDRTVGCGRAMMFETRDSSLSVWWLGEGLPDFAGVDVHELNREPLLCSCEVRRERAGRADPRRWGSRVKGCLTLWELRSKNSRVSHCCAPVMRGEIMHARVT